MVYPLHSAIVNPSFSGGGEKRGTKKPQNNNNKISKIQNHPTMKTNKQTNPQTFTGLAIHLSHYLNHFSMPNSSIRLGQSYFDESILHWNCQDIKHTVDMKLLACTKVAEFLVLFNKFMMENITLFKYIIWPSAASNLTTLKPKEDWLMISTELDSVRILKCCYCSKYFLCNILVILWESMT